MTSTARTRPESGDQLDGRRALVTGGASGIGLAIASDLASRGAEVVIADLPGDRLNNAAAGIGAKAVGVDFSTREGAAVAAGNAGRIDILVNNAGLQHVSSVEDFDPDRWDLLIAVMLTTPFLLIRALIPAMYEQGWGRVVNISSVHGLVASPYKSAYVSAKHGLIGLTKTVALEAAEHAGAVTVNAVCPSYVRTPMVSKQIADQARVHGIPEQEVIDRILLADNAVKRLIEPEEVARVVAFLCSADAWSITGTAVAMDAGRLAR